MLEGCHPLPLRRRADALTHWRKRKNLPRVLAAVSIRLPKQLISQYKLIAHFHGVGYKPLMRDVMARFVPSALKEILEAEQAKSQQSAEQAAAAAAPQKKVA